MGKTHVEPDQNMVPWKVDDSLQEQNGRGCQKVRDPRSCRLMLKSSSFPVLSAVVPLMRRKHTCLVLCLTIYIKLFPEEISVLRLYSKIITAITVVMYPTPKGNQDRSPTKYTHSVIALFPWQSLWVLVGGTQWNCHQHSLMFCCLA